MGEYTAATLAAILVTVALELGWAKTGLFRTGRFWLTMAITWSFQILVDGWLTKLSDPIVFYDPRQITGLRIPPGIPVEDFGFGFALVTLTLIGWQRQKEPR